MTESSRETTRGAVFFRFYRLVKTAGVGKPPASRIGHFCEYERRSSIAGVAALTFRAKRKRGLTWWPLSRKASAFSRSAYRSRNCLPLGRIGNGRPTAPKGTVCESAPGWSLRPYRRLDRLDVETKPVCGGQLAAGHLRRTRRIPFRRALHPPLFSE